MTRPLDVAASTRPGAATPDRSTVRAGVRSRLLRGADAAPARPLSGLVRHTSHVKSPGAHTPGPGETESQ